MGEMGRSMVLQENGTRTINYCNLSLPSLHFPHILTLDIELQHLKPPLNSFVYCLPSFLGSS